MKALQSNKCSFRNGGPETVVFQDHDFLTQNDHEVVDLSTECIEMTAAICRTVKVPYVL